MRMARKFPCFAALGLVGLLASCSDPVSPSGQGSASVHFGTPSQELAAMGKRCSPLVHWADVPSGPAGINRTTGNSRPTYKAQDGTDGSTVTCSVKSSGGKFQVSGTIQSPAFDQDMKLLLHPTSIQIQTTIGKDESDAAGTLVVTDNSTPNQYTGPCVFSVKADTGNNARLAVDAGKIWGMVTCDSIGDNGDPSSVCSASGYFILENCDQ